MNLAHRWLILVLLANVTGCAWLTPRGQTESPIESKTTYAERKEAAVADFEKHRDAAQVHGALSCWERGETQKAQAMLQAIVERSPSNVEARLRLAEMLIDGEESAAAETHLRACLQLAPDAAEVHHTLGLLLSDWPGREAEADSHLQRAAQLEPENVAYAAVATH